MGTFLTKFLCPRLSLYLEPTAGPLFPCFGVLGSLASPSETRKGTLVIPRLGFGGLGLGAV